MKFDHNVLEIRSENSKTNQFRAVPITPTLKALLEMRRTAPDGSEFGPDAYVFGNEVGEPVASVRRVWLDACQRAGIKDLHIHDLRAEFASRMFEGGEPLHILAQWLGHSNSRTTDAYLRTRSVGDLQQAAQRFEQAEARRQEAAKQEAEKTAKARKGRTFVAQTAQTVTSGASSARAGNARKLLH